MALKSVYHNFILLTFIYLVASIINKLKEPHAVVQNVIIKLSTIGNVKSFDIPKEIGCAI